MYTCECLHLIHLRDQGIQHGTRFGNEQGIARAIYELRFERISILKDSYLPGFRFAAGGGEYGIIIDLAKRGVIAVRNDPDKAAQETNYRTNHKFEIPVIDLNYEDQNSQSI